MKNATHVRVTCPSAETFAIQVELFDRYGDTFIEGSLRTTQAGDQHIIEFDTSDPGAIATNDRLATTPGVGIEIDGA